MRLLHALSTLAFLAGLTLMITSVVLVFDGFSNQNKVVTATVIERTEPSTQEGTASNRLSWEYSGKEYKQELTWHPLTEIMAAVSQKPLKSYQEGDTLQLYVHPENPNRYTVKDVRDKAKERMKLLAAPLVITFVLTVILGKICKKRRWRKLQRMMSQGNQFNQTFDQTFDQFR